MKGRPKGSKNKTKLVGVRLSDLNNYLTPNAVVPVDINFLAILNITPTELVSEQPTKISIREITNTDDLE